VEDEEERKALFTARNVPKFLADRHCVSQSREPPWVFGGSTTEDDSAVMNRNHAKYPLHTSTT